MSQELLQKLARPELLAMQGYSSARMEAAAAAIVLNANENPWAPVCDCDPDWQINRYPEPQPQAVRRRLAEIYQISEDHLLVTRGSDEGIDLLIRAFCQAGIDSITYCPPTFGMYAISAVIQNAAVIAIPLDASKNWQPDVNAIQKTKSKLVFLCRPNNPTGHTLTITAVSELCARLSNQSLVIVDEAYIEFSPAQSMASRLDAHPNLVVLRTLSKAWGLAGLRCGAVLASPDIIQLLLKIMAPYPLPIATQRLVAQALNDKNASLVNHRIERLLAERERLADALGDCSAIQKIWPSEANFLLLEVADADTLVAAAAQAGILIRNQSAQPGLDNCIRISIGTPEENTVLLNFLQSYRAKP